MRGGVNVLGLGAQNDPNCGEACTARNIGLENLVVRDGSWTGIYASGGYYQLKTAQYGVVDNLVIAGVESRNNHKAGIEITCTYYQTRIYAASNVMVLDSHLHDNGGDCVLGVVEASGGIRVHQRARCQEARRGLHSFWRSTPSRDLQQCRLLRTGSIGRQADVQRRGRGDYDVDLRQIRQAGCANLQQHLHHQWTNQSSRRQQQP